MNEKIITLRKNMEMLGIDGLIVNNPNNIKYLLGVNAEGALLINTKENFFITDARYTETAKNQITLDDEVVIFDVANLTDEENIGFFQDCNKVGFEENYITYANYNNMVRRYRLKETDETENIIEKQRMIKNDNEISDIRMACKITDDCFKYLLDFIKIGMSEKQIAFEIEKFFIENGADGLAFETIVASGENSSKPHSIPGERTIKFGDVITIDFGAKYKEYCADMTRTFFVGEVSQENRDLYNFILKAQENATERIRDGADGKQIAKEVASTFNLENYSLIHALGHGVGLEVHERPFLSYRTSYTLKENMVVTNEPGIYIPGKVGMRIEDTIKVNKNDCEVLTKSCKDIIII